MSRHKTFTRAWLAPTELARTVARPNVARPNVARPSTAVLPVITCTYTEGSSPQQELWFAP
eukprot:2494519-Rhodomonas_salina.1